MGNQQMAGLQQGMSGMSINQQGPMMGQPRPMVANNMGQYVIASHNSRHLSDISPGLHLYKEVRSYNIHTSST